MKKSINLIFILFFVAQIQAQTVDTLTMPRLRLGVEVGVNAFFNGEVNKPTMIREGQAYYYDNDHNSNYGSVYESGDFTFFYLGIKPEYSLSKRWTVAAGVRFNYNKFELQANGDYFLWKVGETETSSDYIKISKIYEKHYYLSIPLEVRFFPNEKDYTVRFYCVAGTVFHFLLASNTQVTIPNEKMTKYASEVLQQIGEPNIFQGHFFLGAGLKFGKMNHPFGSIEFHFPVFMFGKNNTTSLLNMNGSLGVGFQTTLKIPIFKKHQLIYKVTH